MTTQILTFPHEQFCRLDRRENLWTPTPVTPGLPDALNLYLLAEGACGVAGDGVLLPAGSLAVSALPLTLLPAGDCHILHAALAGEAPRRMAGGLAGPVFFPGSSAGAEVIGATALLHHLADEALTDPVHQSALGYELLCRLARMPAGGELYPPVVTAAIALVRAHYAEVYGVEELAAELGVSKGHLIRSFTASTGLSPGRYLTAVRLEAAKGLLIHRDYPLEVVAGLCGFSGANYLCRVFKKAEGMTPSAWRALNAYEGAAPRPPEPAGDWEQTLYL